MTAPRPSKALYIVIAALLVLLPLLAVLQYQWIGEVSQADRRQLQERLEQAGMQFANDFDRELMRTLTSLQIRIPLDRPDLPDWFAQHYEDATSTYSNLIRRTFVVRRANAGLELLRFDP